uniref:Uncharacterized protein n=1 Tax=Anopheles stephensi TaxID=30069 RepID=A0A182XWJ6_ANOST
MEKCVIQTPRTGPQLLTLVMRTLNVIQRVFIDVVVYSQYQHTRTYLFGTSFDYCEFIAASDSYTNPVAKLVHAVALQKFPQALLECPASGVVNITDVKIDENLVPPIMPAGRYYTHFRMYNKRNQTLLAWKAKSILSQPFFVRRFECDNETNVYMKVLRCNLESPRHSPQLINIVVNIEQPLPKIYVSINLYVKQRQSMMFVYGTTFEYCEFLMRNESRQTNPVAVLIYNYAKHNFPQILRPCPLAGIFNVTGLHVDRNLIPPFVTPGGYFAEQRFFNKRNETVLRYESEFAVSAPSIFNKTMTLFAFKSIIFALKIILKRFQCIGYPYEISKLRYCQLETLRNGTQVTGVVVEILHNLHKVFVTGGLYIQYFRTRAQLLTTTMEYCQENRDPLSVGNAATKFTLDYAQQHFPQLITECPIERGKLFNVTGVRVEDALIPAFVIPGSYYVELRIYNKRNQTVFSGSLDAEIK